MYDILYEILFSWPYTSIIFIIILIIGLYDEWNQGILNWSNWGCS